MPRKSITTSKLEAMLVEGLKADQHFQEQLKALTDAQLKQLWETERTRCEELEKRIHRDSLLSTDKEDKSGENLNVDTVFNPSSLRRSRSTSALVSGKGPSGDDQPLQRPSLSSPAWVTFLTGTTRSGAHDPIQRTPQSIMQPSYVHKELESEAECQKQFRAFPVPTHVSLPLYQQMTQLRETRRKQCLVQRKDFLLSTQKPFSFQERERERREKLVEMLSHVTQDQTSKQPKQTASTVKTAACVEDVKEPVVLTASTVAVKTAACVGEVKAPVVSHPGKDKERCKKVNIHPNRVTIKSSTAPNKTGNTQASSSKPRCSEHTKKQMLGFLDEKPSFKPRISQQVPDFSTRHKAFQTEVLRKAERKDSTKCQPFHLRTSALSLRQSTAKPANSQEPKVSNHLRKSKSFGCLTSLSTETLPTYISDATRKRGVAIRKTLEMKESKKGESAEWMRSFQMRSQAMQKTVAIRAKVTDPHSSLKDVYHEQLQRHREADQQRVKEYTKELRDMKERVTQRPYLFERVKQKHAKAQVEQTYRKKLQEAGLNERFVEAAS
ncbi:Protein FAM161B [Merluccius polli]|uniref:Protein FAM161B n=1 Tax=Merluccius polli TaxID=89951 RepID=A0AA47NS58_MERPO|nr:Protein FAM161B [Merluccius polli]